MKRRLAIVGPTASGKSAFAMALAEKLPLEIVACDSMQVYRGFDIGTAKPSASDRAKVPHHMLDCITWKDHYDASIYAQDAEAACAGITARAKAVAVVGGTGLYLRALWKDRWDDDLPRDEALRQSLRARRLPELYAELQKLDPARAAEIHPADAFRVVRAVEINMLSGKNVPRRQQDDSKAREDWLIVRLKPERDLLRQRIAVRVQGMLQQGFIEEVEKLLHDGCPADAKPMLSIGYKQAVQHITGKLTITETAEAITLATSQYARRQETWFKKMSHAIICEDEKNWHGIHEKIISMLTQI